MNQDKADLLDTELLDGATVCDLWLAGLVALRWKGANLLVYRCSGPVVMPGPLELHAGDATASTVA